MSQPPPPRSNVRQITPKPPGLVESWSRLARSLPLLKSLVRRELRVRYKQTLLGVLWAVVHPLALMLVFTLVFSVVLRVPAEAGPYAPFVYSALIPWTYASTGTSLAMRSLVENIPLVTRVAIQREVLPLASVTASLVDMCIALGLLVVILPVTGQPVSWNVLFLTLAFPVQFLLSAGLGLFVSALNVRYRDIRFIMPLALQIWLYASPVIYPVSAVPDEFLGAYVLNPMVGIIQCYRAALLPGVAFEPAWFAVSALGCVLCFVLGFAYFRRVEWRFADVI